QTTGIPVLVNSTGGPVNAGTVTVTLLNNGVPISTNSSTFTATSTGPSTTVTLTVPAGLAPGTYTLTEIYHDSTGNFTDSSGFGHLVVTSSSPPPSPSITSTGPVTVTGAVASTGAVTVTPSSPDTFTALFTIAIDAAELVLVHHGILSLGGVPLPSAQALMQQILNNIPFGGGLVGAAFSAGTNAGNQFVSGQ